MAPAANRPVAGARLRAIGFRCRLPAATGLCIQSRATSLYTGLHAAPHARTRRRPASSAMPALEPRETSLMDSRRNFLKASAAALTVAATRPLFGAGIQGANDRVRMAIIGAGNRGGRVFDSFMRQKDCQFLAAAEVNKAKLDQWMTAGAPDLQARCRRRLPPHPRAEGHRCRPHCHARPLAQPADGGRHLRRQGRLRREAGLEHHCAHQRDARRLQEGQAGRPGRHASAQLGPLHGGQEAAG